MKKLILVLCIILALLLAFLGLRYFGVLPGASGTPAGVSLFKPKSQPPLEAGEPVYVDGTLLSTVRRDGARYVAATDLAAALDLECSLKKKAAVLGSSETFRFESGSPDAVSGGESFPMTHAPFARDGMLYLSVDDLPAVMKLSSYADPDSGETYLTSGGGDWEIPQGYRVPILAYHAVSNDMWGLEELFMDPAEMEKQLKYLVENGYEPIWFEDLRHIDRYEKPVILTFDDGYDDNYLELLPLLQKYSVKATFFVVAGVLETFEHSMTPEMVTRAAESGLVSVQSHGMTHHDMGVMDAEELRYEFGESKRILTALTKREPYALSYPQGRLTELTLELAGEYFKFGTRSISELYNTSDHPLLCSRFNIARDTTLDEFAAILREATEAG